MRFRVGQRVICIDDRPFRGRVFNIRRGALVKGAVYTVRDYVPQGDWIPPLLIDEDCIRLVEIERKSDKLGFRVSRFRPHVEKKIAKRIKVSRVKESA